MKQKINLRLVSIAILAVLAVSISMTFVFYGLFKNQVKNDLKVTADTLMGTHYFETVDSPEDIDMSSVALEMRVTWVDSDGTVLYDNDTEASGLENHLNRPEIASAFKNGTGESVRRSDTMNMDTYYYAVLLNNGTVLRVAVEASSVTNMFLTALPVIVFILIIIVVICVLLSRLLTRQLIAPIEEMAKDIEDTTKGAPYKELVPFSNMIRKQHTDILDAAKMRQDFTANVSHELKTPLTAISGYAELIENHMVDEKQADRFIGEIRKNAQRLLSLINDIIRLSELDSAHGQYSFEEVELLSLASENLEDYKVSAEKRNVTVTLTGTPARTHGNRDMLQEILDNLVQNAIRYNNDGGHVWISVYSDEGAPVLSVKDDGIGIPEEDQKRVFERFYRVDKSRSRATGGTGLGLAIVKHIAEIHSAKIELNSKLGEGTEVKVFF